MLLIRCHIFGIECLRAQNVVFRSIFLLILCVVRVPCGQCTWYKAFLLYSQNGWKSFHFPFCRERKKIAEPVTSTLNWVKENAAIGCNGSNYPKNNKSELVAACFCLFACIVFGFGCLRRHQHFCSIPFLRLCFSWKSKSPTKLSANSNANWGDAGYNFFVWAANRKELSIKNPKTQTTRIEYRQIIKRRH